MALAAHTVVAIADGLKDELVTRGIDPSKIRVVPNGVDTNRFRPMASDSELEQRLGLQGRIRIGYVGTLYPWEGVEDLVSAARLMLRSNPHVRVLIVGEPLDDRIRNRIRENGLDDQVLLLGSVSHDLILRYYSIMDVLVYPRRKTRNTELVTPLKPLEAMAMAKPVIGSDVGGFGNSGGRSTDSNFQRGTPGSLPKFVLIYAQGWSTAGQRARDYVVASRDWATTTSAYATIYDAAVAQYR